MHQGAGQLVQSPAQEERWRASPWPRARGRIAAACFAALAFHTLLLVGTGWLDRHRDRPLTAAQETPVEVVDEIPDTKLDPPPPQAEPDTAEPAPQPSPAPTPPVAAPSRAAAPPEAGGASAERELPSAPVAAPRAVEVDVSRGQVAGAPAAQPSTELQAQSSEKPPAATATGQGEIKEPPAPSQEDAATADHRLVPPSFRSAALPGATAQTQESYKNQVFGMLERAKRLPPQTSTRHGARAAYVRFMLDRAGNLVSVSLIGSSGDAELDAEAVALVRRAAPFPKPPNEGTLLVFTPVIYFVYDENVGN